MGKINITNQTAPDTPASGDTTLYVDSSSKKLSSKDDTGTVTDYSTGDPDINGKSSVTAATGDEILIADVSDSNNLKKVTAQSIADLGGGGGGGSLTPMDPTTGWVVQGASDFHDHNSASDGIGDIWIPQSSAATCAYLSTYETNNNPGTYVCGNGTSSSWARIYSQDQTAIPGAQSHCMTVIARLTAVPDATNDFEFYMGFSTTIHQSSTSRSLIGCDRTGSTTNWTVNSGTSTNLTATSIAMDADWHCFQIVMNSTDNKFYVDGVLAHTETTNLPTVKMNSLVGSYAWVAGNAQAGVVDYACLAVKTSTRAPGYFDITTL